MQKIENEERLICPDCGSSRLTKAGPIWSGRNRKQQYKCSDCGRCTVNPIELPEGETVLKNSRG